MNHYQRIGVTPNTTLEEVEQAYQTRIQEYKDQAEQGTIIDKEAWEELEKSYQVVKTHLLEANKKRIPQGLKFLFMFMGAIAIVFSPILLAVSTQNYALLILIPVFFFLLVFYNSYLNMRKHQENNQGKMYRPNERQNKNNSLTSIIWTVVIFIGIFFLSYASEEEGFGDIPDYIEGAIGIIALIGGGFMLYRDWRNSRQKPS